MRLINLIPLIISSSLSLSLTPIAIRVATAKRIFDIPDNSTLKIHKSPIPNIGGVVVFITATLTLLISSAFIHLHKEIYGLIIGCFIVMVLGIADDLKSISALIRILGHFLISLIPIAFGFTINIFSSTFFNIVATSFLIVGSINSINLLDGMDGLAAGVSAICSVGFIFLAIFQNNLFALIVSLSLLGTILGFLPYNFYPSKIFLGDSGSTLLGFVLAILFISISSQSGSLFYFFAPILVLGLPILDTGYAILRRMNRKKNIFTGDREHFYDQLMKRGLSQMQTTIIGYSLSLIFAIIGLSLIKFFH